jgi:hypothetical protein
MTIHVSWEAVSAICGALTMLAAALAWFIRAIVRQEMGKLSELYVGAPVFEAYVEATRDHLELLERRHAA